MTGAVRPQKLGGAFALAAAGFLLLHGNLVLAALLGLGGIWMIEGQAAMTERLARLVKSRFGPGLRHRTALLDVRLRPDGSIRDGRVSAEGRGGAEYAVVGPTGSLHLPAHALDVLPPGARVVVEVEGDQVVLKPTDATPPGEGGS